jgi:hypothetical protein
MDRVRGRLYETLDPTMAFMKNATGMLLAEIDDKKNESFSEAEFHLTAVPGVGVVLMAALFICRNDGELRYQTGGYA